MTIGPSTPAGLVGRVSKMLCAASWVSIADVIGPSNSWCGRSRSSHSSCAYWCGRIKGSATWAHAHPRHVAAVVRLGHARVHTPDPRTVQVPQERVPQAVVANVELESDRHQRFWSGRGELHVVLGPAPNERKASGHVEIRITTLTA